MRSHSDVDFSRRNAHAIARGAPTAVTRVGALAFAFAALFAVGCKRTPPSGVLAPTPSGSVTLPAPIASAIPGAALEVSKAVNPKQESVYSGPAGSVHGTITVKGDFAPQQSDLLVQIKDDCAPARSVVGPLFREGEGRALADVLVAVTGYAGYVPEQHSVVELDGIGCAWSARTIALTFGQRIDVVSKDHKAYVPDLMGSKMAAQIIALPGGSGSSVYPQAPGRYLLIDSLHIFSAAEVLVLKYATHAVTGLDGKFEIERIPAGKVTLSAFLPATAQTVERSIEIQPSRSTQANLEFDFSLETYKKQLAAAHLPGAQPSASDAARSAAASAASSPGAQRAATKSR